jgi:hypothetical protein
MPVYFFNIYGREQTEDDVGTDCADLAEVRTEAVETLKEYARSNLLAEADVAALTINVVDEEKRTVMIVSLSASVLTVEGSSALQEER